MKIKNFVFVSVLLLLGVQPTRITSAQTYVQCGGDNPASAIVLIPAGSYDVYAKLGKTGVSEQATLSMQSLNSIGTSDDCKNYTPEQVSSLQFTKVATNVALDGNPFSAYLASPSSETMQSASEPQIVFVPHNNPPCQLLTDCSVTYQGLIMQLSPKKVSLTSDSLRVGQLLDISDDKVKTVIYSVDGKPVYERPTLEDFNTNYVAGGDHTLVRRVVFASGASVSDSKKYEKGTSIDIGYYVQAILFGQSTLIKIGLYIAAVTVLLWAILYFLKKIQKRRIWKHTHIASDSSYTIDSKKVGGQKHFYDESTLMTIYRYHKYLLGLLGVAAFLLVGTTYIVGVFTVDGVSMFPTLQDKSVHPLVKIQKTLAKINRSEYVPKRGDIVVLNKDENNLFDPQAAIAKNYVVKRVIGLPHERIVIKNGVVTLFNKQHEKGFVPDDQYHWVSDLTGSENFNIDLTLKDSEIFVMGDNRDESIDSRFYGPIDTKEIIGKVIP